MTKKRLIAAGVAVIAALALSASALALVGGSPDNGAHPYVGMFVSPEPTGSGGAELCTGSLISPQVFVTAAHCVHPGWPVFVTMDENGLGGLEQGHLIPGYAIAYPGWTTGDHGLSSSDRNDFAVVLLAGPVDLPVYASLPAVGSDDKLPNNQRVNVLGYGVQQPPDQGFGSRLVAGAKIIPGGGVTGDTFLKISGGATCFGDSGGPVLVGNTMVAINSYGPSASCKAVAYAQRLDTPEALAFISGGFARYLPH